MPRRGRDSDDGSENQEVVGTFETLRDEGEHFVHVKQYEKAIESFTKALDFNGEDKGCLVARSRCWLQLGYSENALADAESALLQDKDFIRGLYQKAEAKYQLGEFETALVFFHRGHKLRPEYQEFRLGIQKSQEAINNSIGHPDSVKLSAEGDLSYFYKQEEAKAKARGTYGKPGAKVETKKEKERPKNTSDTKTIKQLLGELYGDKYYLEKLLSDESVTGGNSQMNRAIKGKVTDALDYLDIRADFWRQQKPMYARKRDRDRQRKSAKDRQKDPTKYLLERLEEIDNDQVAERYERSLNTAKKTLDKVELMSDEQLQNKAEIKANLHSQIGNAYLELGKYGLALDHHKIDRTLAEDNYLEDAKSRALDNLGRVYARQGNYTKAIEIWEEKLPLSKSPLESTWLYHEIGRCYLELQKYQDSRDFGEKSLQAAKEADDEGWQLHASVLAAQSEAKLGDLHAAADSFEKAYEIAKKLNDTAAANAIQKAREEINSRIVRGVKDKEDGEDDDDRGSVKEEDGRKSQVSVKGDNYEDDFEEEDKEIRNRSAFKEEDKLNENEGKGRKNSRSASHDEKVKKMEDDVKCQTREEGYSDTRRYSSRKGSNESEQKSRFNSPESPRTRKSSSSSNRTRLSERSSGKSLGSKSSESNLKGSDGGSKSLDDKINSPGSKENVTSTNNGLEETSKDGDDPVKEVEIDEKENQNDGKNDDNVTDIENREEVTEGSNSDEGIEIITDGNVAQGDNLEGTEGNTERKDSKKSKPDSNTESGKKNGKRKSKDSVMSPYGVTYKKSADSSSIIKRAPTMSKSSQKKQSLSRKSSGGSTVSRRNSGKSTSSNKSIGSPRKLEEKRKSTKSLNGVEVAKLLDPPRRDSFQDDIIEDKDQGKYDGEKSFLEHLESKEREEKGNAVDFKVPTGVPSPVRSPRASPAKRSVSIKEPSPTGRDSAEAQSRASKAPSEKGSVQSGGKDASPAPNTTPIQESTPVQQSTPIPSQTEEAKARSRTPSEGTLEEKETDNETTDQDRTERESDTQVEVETEEITETDQGKKSATPEAKETEQKEEQQTDKEEEEQATKS